MLDRISLNPAKNKLIGTESACKNVVIRVGILECKAQTDRHTLKKVPKQEGLVV